MDAKKWSVEHQASNARPREAWAAEASQRAGKSFFGNQCGSPFKSWFLRTKATAKLSPWVRFYVYYK